MKLLSLGKITIDVPVSVKGQERRREQRIAVNNLTVISSLTVAGRERVTGHILDVSSSGMRVRTERRFAPGMRLRVSLKDVAVDAIVCYTRRVANSFDHGLQVVEVWEEPMAQMRDGLRALATASRFA